jgi:uncharacterized protein
MEQRVSLITLGVRDMAAQAAFYENLGWRRVGNTEGVIVYDLIGQTLGLYPLADLANDLGLAIEDLGHGAMTLAHNVPAKEDVAPLINKAVAAGARLLRPAQDVFWGGHVGYFSDPEGHIWEIAWNPHAPLGPHGEFQWNGAA